MVVPFGGVLFVEQAHIAVHLSNILMGQLPHLQIDQHIALEDAVVKHQIDKEELIIIPKSL